LLARYRQLSESARLAEQTRLVEVIPFACALAYSYKTHELISQLAETNNHRLLAQTFLESKAYDHPHWRVFVEQQKSKLLSSRDRDAGWLSDLHLFILMSVDASRTVYIRADVDAPTTDEIVRFLGQLGGQEQEAIFTLIDEYARQDAVAAFRVASLCRVDILQINPLFVVENCLQPAFLAMALDKLSSELPRFHRWSCAIAEAGLRSVAVSRALGLISNSPWSKGVDDIDRERRWFIEPLVPRNMLTECITYCLSTSSVEPVFDRLAALNEHSPLGKYKVRRSYRPKLVTAGIGKAAYRGGA
jgi:hypothetical protein